MFDIGWSEMLVIALVALVVIGPKELPGALKTFAQWMRHARKLAREFQSGIDDIVREAELDDAKKALQSVSSANVGREIEKAVDPTGDLKKALEEEPEEEPAAPPAPTPSIPAATPMTGNGATTPAPAPPPAVEPSGPQPAGTPAELKP